MPNWKKILLNGGSGELTTLKLTNLTEDNTGTKVLTLDTNNNIKLTGSFGGGGGTLTGDGVATRIPYYSGTTTLTNESGFTYTEASDKLAVGNVSLNGGNEGSPSLYFGGRTSTGLWWSYSPNTINITRNGTTKVEIGTDTTIADGTIRNTNGSATAPSYTFTNNTDTGIYVSGVSDQLNITTGGVNRLSVSTTEIQALLPFQSSNGAKGAPQYSFGNDSDTGMYLSSVGTLGFTVAGENRLLLSDAYTEVENTLKLDSVSEGTGILRYLVWDSGDDNSVKWQTVSTSGVTSVTGTAPIVSSGGTTPAISISAATTSAAGSMSAADKTKIDGLVAVNSNSIIVRGGAFSSQATTTNLTATSNDDGKVLVFNYATELGQDQSEWVLETRGDITQVTAGTGMTGGSTSGNATLNVIGGDGITANADDIEVDSTVVRTTGAQTITGVKSFNDSVNVGQHDGEDRLYVNRYNSSFPHAYIQAGSADNNVPVGLKINTRNAAGSAQLHMTLDATNIFTTLEGGLTCKGNFSTNGGGTAGSVTTTYASVGNGTASSPAIRFTNDTDLGFFKNASAAKLEVTVGGASKTQFDTNGVQTLSLGVGTAPTSTTGLIRATNDVVAYYSSDRKLKDNIKNIKNPIEKLKKINGVEFDWIPEEGVHENEGHDVGVIAQEIEKIIPEIVQTRDNGYKAVKYEKIVPLLIEAIKEQQKQIDELKSKL